MNQMPDWTRETINMINKLTPDIKGKAFDPDWFLLLQRLEEAGRIMDSTRRAEAVFLSPQIGTKIF